ncbi:MAG: hypothetical protein EBS54_06345 [Betaproteobacteria bacterium]|nr:hypothetical protein [Betaproteobacteria bacterium]NBT06346.1 hypothetical protein [Betaproteobacteria bacterium]NBT82877.1 hypothetical protein [Betaproteobacteria bacterium]NDC86810.1 hypothetical protein [Betaproteobacteria bacterium]NDG83046.1 hypothetical protein [Betaproteobacteria bacterium]
MSTSSVGPSGTMIDVQGIVSKLMTIEKKPLSATQGRIQTAQSSISAMGQLMSLVDSVYSTSNAIQDRAMLTSKSASSSDTAIAKVSVFDSAQAPAGSFNFETIEFARAQRSVFFGSGANAVNDPALGRGDERIQIDVNDPSSGRKEVILDFSGASLDQIRDSVNSHPDLKGKVSASVVRRSDSNGVAQDYVLVLNGLQTGTAASFVANWTTFPAGSMTQDIPVALADLPANPSAAQLATVGFGSYGSQTAQNAVARVNGVIVGSSTNVFSSAIPGLSIEALKKTTTAGSASVSITVGDSRNALKSRLQAFAAALSDFNRKIADLTKSGTTSTVAGPLASNSAVLSLTSAISSSYSAGFTLNNQPGTNYWSKIGLDYGRDGSVSFDGSKLDQALDGDPSFATNLLAGFSSSLYVTVNSLRGAAGSIQSGISTMQTRLSSLKSDEATLKSKLEARQKLLLAQYASLDSKLVSMGQQRNNVSQALASLR